MDALALTWPLSPRLLLFLFVLIYAFPLFAYYSFIETFNGYLQRLIIHKATMVCSVLAARYALVEKGTLVPKDRHWCG